MVRTCPPSTLTASLATRNSRVEFLRLFMELRRYHIDTCQDLCCCAVIKISVTHTRHFVRNQSKTLTMVYGYRRHGRVCLRLRRGRYDVSFTLSPLVTWLLTPMALHSKLLCRCQWNCVAAGAVGTRAARAGILLPSPPPPLLPRPSPRCPP